MGKKINGKKCEDIGFRMEKKEGDHGQGRPSWKGKKKEGGPEFRSLSKQKPQ